MFYCCIVLFCFCLFSLNVNFFFQFALFPLTLWRLVLPLHKFEWRDFGQWDTWILLANSCLLPTQQPTLLSSFSVKKSVLYPPINPCNLFLAFSHQSCASHPADFYSCFTPACQALWDLGTLSASYTSHYFSVAGRKNYVVIHGPICEMHLMDGQAIKYWKVMQEECFLP